MIKRSLEPQLSDGRGLVHEMPASRGFDGTKNQEMSAKGAGTKDQSVYKLNNTTSDL